jgi:hypothetical protein
MKLRLDIDLGNDVDGDALSQLFAWAKKLDAGASSTMTQGMDFVRKEPRELQEGPQEQIGAQPKDAPPAAKPGKPRKNADAPAGAATQPAPANPPPPNPPAPVAVEQTPQPAVTNGAAGPVALPGAPPGAMPIPGAPVASIAAVPGGAGSPAMVPQQPAMPAAVETGPTADGAIGVTELQAAYGRNPQKAFQVLRAETWSDGTAKQRWANINQVPVEFREKLAMEYAAF